MRDNITYALPTYKCFDLAYESILAALHSSIPPNKILIADNSGNGTAAHYLHPLVEKFSNVYILPLPYNNLSLAWNTFQQTLADDYIIIANDDIQVDTYTIEHMINAAKNTPDQIFFAGDGASGNAFSLFLLKHRGYEQIGPFDERFHPAYYEDNDYARRMLLKGYHIVSVHGATYQHSASSTLKRYTQQEMEAHHHAFRTNAQYYIAKWGGMPTEEIFETPFDR